ncbi:hypothetical protein [Tenacibaculum sp. 190524A02b]|uniref:Uncharacterized protein n=1 Tax=Tenacibaculum vairaonense TaxID=3137860 RepID=A0ABM9PNW3_9FLAO
MEEIVFRALLGNTKFTKIESFIQNILDSSSSEVTYEAVRESIIKLVLYRFIKVNPNTTKEDCILKESNFYEARQLGGVAPWLEKRRAYR